MYEDRHCWLCGLMVEDKPCFYLDSQWGIRKPVCQACIEDKLAEAEVALLWARLRGKEAA